MKTSIDNQSAILKPYEAPKVTPYGSVVNLTQQGDTNPGGDLRDGSVYPPGQS